MKKSTTNLLKSYKYVLILIIIIALMCIIQPSEGYAAMVITKKNLLEMVYVIPPIFILLGLLDVWVPKETMMKYMGKNSHVKGIVLAFMLGSCAAGPLYVSFPIAVTLLKKRASFFNVFVFIGAWSTTKVPMFLFETSSMGWKFSILRLILSVIGILIIAKALDITTDNIDKEKIFNYVESEV